MRVSPIRCTLVILFMASLAGCECGDCWSTPDWAFWKSSPPSLAPGSTPASAATPVMPSSMVAGPGAAGFDPAYSGLPASAIQPGTAYPVSPAGSAAYSSSALPYPSSSPSSLPSYGGQSQGTGPYMTPQQGAYRTGSATSTTPTTSPYAGTSPYASTPRYTGPTTSPYGASGSSQGAPAASDYLNPGSTAGQYANPVRPAPPYAASADPYTNNTDRYGSGATPYEGSGDRYSGGSARYGATPAYSASPGGDSSRTGDRYSDSRLPDSPYGSGNASPYTSQPNSGTNASGHQNDAASGSQYDGGYRYPSTSPYHTSPQAANPATNTQSTTGVADRYAPSGQSGAGLGTPSGYRSPYLPSRPASSQSSSAPSSATGYPAGPNANSNYDSPVPGYTPPAQSVPSYYNPPTSSTGSPAPYMPGSTGQYVPRTPSPNTTGATSAYPAALPGTRSGVTRADYSQPLSSSYR
jgi:hypothetical protein